MQERSGRAGAIPPMQRYTEGRVRVPLVTRKVAVRWETTSEGCCGYRARAADRSRVRGDARGAYLGAMSDEVRQLDGVAAVGDEAGGEAAAGGGSAGVVDRHVKQLDKVW